MILKQYFKCNELSPVIISQNKDLEVNLAHSTSNAYSENMGHPKPIKIVIFKSVPDY